MKVYKLEKIICNAIHVNMTFKVNTTLKAVVFVNRALLTTINKKPDGLYVMKKTLSNTEQNRDCILKLYLYFSDIGSMAVATVTNEQITTLFNPQNC